MVSGRVFINLFISLPDHPRYVEANTGCKHFDVHGGPENIPVSRSSFDAEALMFYFTSI